MVAAAAAAAAAAAKAKKMFLVFGGCSVNLSQMHTELMFFPVNFVVSTIHCPRFLCPCGMSSRGRSRISVWEGQWQEVWGMEVPQRDPGVEPRCGSGRKAPRIPKNVTS